MPRKYDLTLSPEQDCTVPDGDGYYIAQSLADSATDRRLDRPTTLSISMLMDGTFEKGPEPHTKTVDASEQYTLRLSTLDPEDAPRLATLIEPFLDGEAISIDGATFTVTDQHRTDGSLADLWTKAAQIAPRSPEIELAFRTPTCVTHPNSSVTEMFPHRRSIFPHLAAHWNRVQHRTAATGAPLQAIALDPFDVGTSIFEKPNTDSYRTYSTLTDLRTRDDGEIVPFLRQGYVGRCSYAFRHADQTVTQAVTALSLFAEYSGIGTDTHHGCGCIDTTIRTRGGR